MTAQQRRHSRVVEQAKGVLGQYGQLTMDNAFDRLRRYARRYRLLLGQVSRRVLPNATPLTRPCPPREVTSPSGASDSIRW
ncbi:ANTAR domain-containing protein [Pseudonocardia charpentierae]|uniref:ANTAR domain-containing protein n=1 Tax=Pseudonocardia charpentierae TaxID=3075545 RepID=A0ABU2N4A3_9PSEU|nr:ANTAR domain-containing protein [Pseudonocardia sp. DSM 45834]MDT0348571.1 ANTAR domain-containing protein [Pseudonocardia sp. DSM 45834]